MNMHAVILAAGSSSRLAAEGIAVPKQFMEYKGVPVFWHSARTFSRLAEITGIVFVFPPLSGEDESASLASHAARIRCLDAADPLRIPWKIAHGGPRRQDSVKNGLDALPFACKAVLVHDSARPFMTAALASTVAQAVLAGHAAVVPGIPLADTIKEVDEAGMVVATPTRSSLRAVQTPQGFLVDALRQAHAHAAIHGYEGTDDAQLVEYLGQSVLVVTGEESNKKITRPGDLAMLEKEDQTMRLPCTGFGYDVHRYGGKRPFILGGVPIKTDITVAAHSDGDTLLHALMDALLGLIGGGDIGGMFPDDDPAFEGISSGILLSEVCDRVRRAGVELTHADVTIIAQVPRIAPHAAAIAKNVASLLQLSPEQVNVKATTEERLGFTGEKKGIKVACVVTGLREQALL